MRDYQSACVDMMQMLTLEGRFAQLPEPEREAVEVLQRVLRSAHDPGAPPPHPLRWSWLH